MKERAVYYTYRLYFKEDCRSYIGFTYKVNKRLWDHNYKVKANKEDTTKSKWLRENIDLGYVLEQEILFTGTKQEAKDMELHYIKHYFHNGGVVNSNRLLEAGLGKGFKNVSAETTAKMSDRFSQKFVIIDKQGVITGVDKLRKFAEENNICYSDLSACANGKLKSTANLKVYKESLWSKMTVSEKSKEIEDFKVYNKYATPECKDQKEKLKKTYWLLQADGTYESLLGLSTYCKQYNLNEGNLFTSIKTKRPSSGMILFYKEEDLLEFRVTSMHLFITKLSEEQVINIRRSVRTLKTNSHERGTKIKELAKEYGMVDRSIRAIVENKTYKYYGE